MTYKAYGESKLLNLCGDDGIMAHRWLQQEEGVAMKPPSHTALELADGAQSMIKAFSYIT